MGRLGTYRPSSCSRPRPKAPGAAGASRSSTSEIGEPRLSHTPSQQSGDLASARWTRARNALRALRRTPEACRDASRQSTITETEPGVPRAAEAVVLSTPRRPTHHVLHDPGTLGRAPGDEVIYPNPGSRFYESVIISWCAEGGADSRPGAGGERVSLFDLEPVSEKSLLPVPS